MLFYPLEVFSLLDKDTREEKIMKKTKSVIGEEGIYDARVLGSPRMLVLGFQHMFAMFGATVLVPALTGLSVSSTLLFAGLGTLLFHLISKGKVPAFLGSSFAFLAGYWAIAPNGEAELLPYACFGVACAGLLYVILSALFRAFGPQKVMRFFPPIVTGPVIIAIGLTLSSSAITNSGSCWWLAVIAIAVVIVANIWGKGMAKIIPILLGVIISYTVAAVIGSIWGQPVDIDGTTYLCAFGNENFKIFSQAALDNLDSAAWLGLPFRWNDTVFGLFGGKVDTGLLVTAVITIVPLSLATMVEHIGDICAISSTCNRNYIEDPGLHRTLLGDGLATVLASLFGAPANTTYGENTGVLALSKVYDPRVIRIAAALAVIFSFCPKFAALIILMPTATIGGVSLVLYGMISAVGVRNVVENKVDFTKSRNVIIAALILVLSIGISYGPGAIAFNIGEATISLSGLAVAALVGIILNAVLPGKDYVFGKDILGDTSVSFKV